jgi:hypothetical protein
MVWARNGVRPFRYDAFPQARFLLLPRNGECYPSNKEQIRALAATIRRQGRQIIAPVRMEMQTLIKELGVLRNCSMGLIVAALLRKLRADFSPSSLYGMSFAHSGCDNWAEGGRLHYCDELPSGPNAYEEHSRPSERAAFMRFFGVHADNIFCDSVKKQDAGS